MLYLKELVLPSKKGRSGFSPNYPNRRIRPTHVSGRVSHYPQISLNDTFISRVVRRVSINLGSMQFIVESFQVSNTDMTLFGMSFLMFLSAQEYL